MKNATYEAECADCGKKVEITSPASLSCQSCGGGSFKFKQTMLFKCFYGHSHISKESNTNCAECNNADRSSYRTFEPTSLMTKSKKQIEVTQEEEPPESIGDEDNRMPETKKVHASKPKKTKSGIKIRKRPKK